MSILCDTVIQRYSFIHSTLLEERRHELCPPWVRRIGKQFVLFFILIEKGIYYQFGALQHVFVFFSTQSATLTTTSWIVQICENSRLWWLRVNFKMWPINPLEWSDVRATSNGRPFESSVSLAWRRNGQLSDMATWTLCSATRVNNISSIVPPVDRVIVGDALAVSLGLALPTAKLPVPGAPREDFLIFQHFSCPDRKVDVFGLRYSRCVEIPDASLFSVLGLANRFCRSFLFSLSHRNHPTHFQAHIEVREFDSAPVIVHVDPNADLHTALGPGDEIVINSKTGEKCTLFLLPTKMIPGRLSHRQVGGRRQPLLSIRTLRSYNIVSSIKWPVHFIKKTTKFSHFPSSVYWIFVLFYWIFAVIYRVMIEPKRPYVGYLSATKKYRIVHVSECVFLCIRKHIPFRWTHLATPLPCPARLRVWVERWSGTLFIQNLAKWNT